MALSGWGVVGHDGDVFDGGTAWLSIVKVSCLLICAGRSCCVELRSWGILTATTAVL